MYKIIDKSGNGKTSRLMLLTKEKNGILVCSNPEAMKVKAYSYGLEDIEIISYFDYINDLDWYNRKPIFIDELEDFLKQVYSSILGFSLTIED